MLRRLLIPITALGLGMLASSVMAHELPERVVVRMIASVQPGSVTLMVRVPLEAMRDVDFPLTPEGYLLIDEAGPALSQAAGLWVVDALELRYRGEPLVQRERQVRLALPSSRAFNSAAAARRHFSSPPIDADTRIYWRQALLDVRIAYTAPAPFDSHRLTLGAAMQHLGVSTQVDLRVVDTDGSEYGLVFDGFVDALPLRPNAWRVAAKFAREGVQHILGGVDHLLFLLCMVLPVRRLVPLLQAVTAFTVAHSITLALAATGHVPSALWFPSLVESIIAVSIVFLAAENALQMGLRWRWATAFGFGLAHGFGFASALRQSLQFAPDHQMLALASFNVGVELGQLAVLAALVPALALLLRSAPSKRMMILGVSLIAGHTGWHWMTQRLSTLWGYFG
jgi:hypothetical protein